MGLTRLAAGVALATVAAGAGAQNFPTKPVHMYIGFLPGTSTDLLARMLGQKMTEAWGQQVVVDNRPGGNWVIGVESCLKGGTDGYTLCVPSFSQMTMNPVLYSKLPYDPLRDFLPVTEIAAPAVALVIHFSPILQRACDLARASGDGHILAGTIKDVVTRYATQTGHYVSRRSVV